MGQILRILAGADVRPERWPFSGRFQIEDNVGETVHMHINNWRLEFTREQYLDFALVVQTAADELKKVMDNG